MHTEWEHSKYAYNGTIYEWFNYDLNYLLFRNQSNMKSQNVKRFLFNTHECQYYWSRASFPVLCYNKTFSHFWFNYILLYYLQCNVGNLFGAHVDMNRWRIWNNYLILGLQIIHYTHDRTFTISIGWYP